MPAVTRRIYGLSFRASLLALLSLSLWSCGSSSESKPLDDGEFWKGGYKVLLGGDMGLGDTYDDAKKVLEKKGYDYAFQKVAPFMEAVDFSIINLETPITDLDCSKYKDLKDWVHRGDPGLYAKYLKKYRINAVSLANNHTTDCGAEGLKQTMKILDDNNIVHFGAGANPEEAGRTFFKDLKIGGDRLKLVIPAAYEYKNKKDDPVYTAQFALAGSPGANPLLVNEYVAKIKKLKKENKGSFVLALLHWGSNYKWKSKRQASAATKIIDAGADIVIGHGAHLIQEIEKRKGKWVVYSLGNFLFASNGRYQKKKVWPYSQVAVLRFSFENKKLKSRLRLYPIFSDNLITDYQTRPLDKKEFDEVIKLLKEQSKDAYPSDLATGKDKLGYYMEAVVR